MSQKGENKLQTELKYNKNETALILKNILKFDSKSADLPRCRTEFVNPISL